MTQGFDEWFDKDEHPLMDCDKWSAEIGYKAGAASRQAEIDELRKRLAMYERQGYKLVPVEPTEEILDAARRRQWDDLSSPFEDMDMLKYKAMIGVVE